MLAGAVSCSPEENDYEFSKSIIFMGEDEKDTGLPGKLIKGALAGKLRLSTLSALVGAASAGSKIRKHYDNFPANPEDYPNWKQKADALWAKTRGMADASDKDAAVLGV